MSEIRAITWRDLTGNKFLKAVHPAMLSKENYICTQRIRRVGEDTPDIFKTTYDREYVVQWISKRVCKPFAFLGKEKVMELIEEAWALYAKQTLSPYQNFEE